MEEEKKEERIVEEDVLLKLSMPGQSLREETLEKGKAAQQRFTLQAQQNGSSPTQPPQHLEPQPDDDILTKLSMPGQSLREETLEKQKAAQANVASSSLPPQHLEPQPNDDMLMKLTHPSLSSSAPEPERETPRTNPGGSTQGVDVTKIQQLAESIFTRDFSFTKKK